MNGRQLINEATLKATLDWIEVLVTLPRPSQFRHVQAKLQVFTGRTVFVEPLDGQSSSRRFQFRIQDPRGPDDLMTTVQCLRRDSDVPISELDVEVKGVEIAIDAYLPNGQVSSLAQIAGHFLRHLANPPSGTPRITEKGRYRAAACARDVLHALQGDCTINLGGRDADFRVRSYVKRHDTGAWGESYAVLPANQQRARIEHTLMGLECPFSTIEAWRQFEFQRLSRRFAMVRPAGSSVGLLGVIQNAKSQLGRAPDAYKRRASDRRMRPLGTRRDSQLNDRIRMALRGLSRAHGCQNSGTNVRLDTLLSEGKRPTLQMTPEYLITSTTMSFFIDHRDKSRLTESFDLDYPLPVTELGIQGHPDEWSQQ